MARILYIETYGTGSHARTLELLQRQSQHEVESLVLPAEHWRWRAVAAHYPLVEHIQQRHLRRPEGIVLSGPLNVGALVAMLPSNWQDVPRATYFHESQWTYPFPPEDPRPYLTGHLDAVELSDYIWFNSRFHRDAFWQTAVENVSRRVSNLAGAVLRERGDSTCIVYPPVQLDSEPDAGCNSREKKRLLWCARWEREKRPDRFVEAVEKLRAMRDDFELVVLGSGSIPQPGDDPWFERIAEQVVVRGPLKSRDDYEGALRESDVVVSVAEHEFFGISVLEAVQAGCVPVLPSDLAYPETIPSALFYRSGDAQELVVRLGQALDHSWSYPAPWRSDAMRFAPDYTVPSFDLAVNELVGI